MTVNEVAPGVFHVQGTAVNFYLVREGTDVTLVDSGYRGDALKVEAAVSEIGARPEDVQAILLTHAHIDHVGGARYLYDRYRIPTYTDAIEVPHARRDYLEQASPSDVVRNLWRPGAARWTSAIIRAGALQKIRLPHTETFPGDGALDLPGRPVPVGTHGHTSGHTAYLLPSVGAIVTGDGLVTGHALLRHRGPQLLPSFFNHGDALAGLTSLAKVNADLVLPGHGAPLHMPIARAVDEARARAT